MYGEVGGLTFFASEKQCWSNLKGALRGVVISAGAPFPNMAVPGSCPAPVWTLAHVFSPFKKLKQKILSDWELKIKADILQFCDLKFL